MTLMILICTIPERALKLKELLHILIPQIDKHPEVSYKVHDAGKNLPTGTKRNQLIEQTESDYFCFIDDDDHISENYLDSIMNAIQSGPDVVTFNGWMTTNGASHVNWEIKLGEKYEERYGKYYRFPNHLCAFKRDKVRHIKFPAIWKGEDYQWAKKINDLKILKTEVHIDEQLYHYDFKCEVSIQKPTRWRHR